MCHRAGAVKAIVELRAQVPQRARTVNIITLQVYVEYFACAQCWPETNTGRAHDAELPHLLLRQGELFKADGEVASARAQPVGQQRYLMASSFSEHRVHAGPSIAASCEDADSSDKMRLDGLAQQEQLLTKQVSREKHTRPCKSNR